MKPAGGSTCRWLPKRPVGVFDIIPDAVVIYSNMKAELLIDERFVIGADAFVEIVVWRLPAMQRGSQHQVKYRLAYIVRGHCVLRYDNEAGKGDHRHRGNREEPYVFSDVDQLLVDFWTDVDEWSKR